MSASRLVLMAASLVAFAGGGHAAPPAAKRPALTPAEAKAVDACLDMIRGCQLPDGAFVQVNRGRAPKSAVWVAPYFVNYAALALLAGHERNKTPADLDRVGRWLAWCAKNQAAEGYWNDFEGTVASYRNNGKPVDAWDSSAAMFLLVAGRYQRAGGGVTPAVLAAAKKALRCVEAVTDGDGLTWAKPTYKVKYLLDNIETGAGLRSAASLFTAAGAKDEARRAGGHADRVSKRLPDFWRADVKLFAFVLHENGTFEGGLDESYPHALAQLFGVGFVAPKAEAWAAATKKFAPDRGPTAPAGAERWLVAASRLGGKEATAWRAKAVAEAGTFTPANVYLYRPAVMALGLLEGADWMPTSAGGK